MAQLPKWAIILLAVQTLAIAVLFFFSFELRLKPIDMSYDDWIAILLTGISLMIAILAVFLGVLAFIGWQNFDKRVAGHTEACLERGFQKDGRLRSVLTSAVEAVSYDIGNTATDENSEIENSEQDDVS